MNWLAVVLLITAFTYALDLIEPSDTNLSPLTNFDQAVMWFGTLLTGVIGIGWLWQGLCRAPALTMTNTELSGHTILGTKTIRWQDIDRLQVKRNYRNGEEMIIHAKRGSPSSGTWRNWIIVTVKQVDRTLDEIVEAIHVYRPDLNV